MKKCFILLLLFPFITLYAQENTEPYKKFLVEGKTWECARTDYMHVFGDTYYTPDLYKIVVKGDTIIQGRQCKKLYHIDKDGEHVEACLYEDGYKVFFSSGKLLYDFLLGEGDVVYSIQGRENTPHEMRIDAYTGVWRGNSTIGYDFYMFYFLEEFDENGMKVNDGLSDTWQDGVGSLSAGNPLTRVTYSSSSYSDIMYRCSCDNKVLYENVEFVEKLAIGAVTIDKQKESDAVYDLLGRRVQTPQRGGLYIRNGRKFVQR